MKKLVVVGVLILVLVACGTHNQNKTYEPNKALDDMVENKTFEIKSSWASPQVTQAMQQLGNAGLFPQGSTAGNIDISNHANYLIMKHDTIKAVLPFYGERQFGSGYNSNEGIEFEGIPNDLQIEKGKKAEYAIRFKIKDKNSNSEQYQVYITLYSNLTSSITINSTQRNTIQFKGNVNKLDSET
jgi:hypothetical protein